MAEPSSHLVAWSNFYVITGSSAAALTGLMFVVITLVTQSERARRSREGISIYSTPTVAHFGGALFLSAVAAAPWKSLVQVGVVAGVFGLFGVAYVLHLTYRSMRLARSPAGSYIPDAEDWAWYTILPFAAYGAILAGALVLYAAADRGLFALAAGVLLLIFIGIHNAWDVVTFIITDDMPQRRD